MRLADLGSELLLTEAILEEEESGLRFRFFLIPISNAARLVLVLYLHPRDQTRFDLFHHRESLSSGLSELETARSGSVISHVQSSKSCSRD